MPARPVADDDPSPIPPAPRGEMYTQIPSNVDATGLRIGLAVSRYHSEITDRLRDAAVEFFLAHGGSEDRLLVVPVPGSFELIAACRAFVDGDSFDAAVALGCVIAGETTHDTYINQALAHGLSALIAQRGMPISFGVLTCATIDQARARAGGAVGNKGEEAMAAAIEMARTRAAIGNHEGGS